MPSIVIEEGDKVTFIKPQIVQTDQGESSIIIFILLDNGGISTEQEISMSTITVEQMQNILNSVCI